MTINAFAKSITSNTGTTMLRDTEGNDDNVIALKNTGTGSTKMGPG